MAYIYSVVFVQKLLKLDATVKIIVGGLVVYFFGTQCINLKHHR